MSQKLRFLCFRGIHNSLPSFWAKLGYSRIKIYHIADYLLKDAVLTLGVNLCLSSFSVDLSCIHLAVQCNVDKLKCFHFLAPASMKKTPSKVGYFSKIAEFSVLPKTAQPAQKQKGIRLILMFIALGIYNFELSMASQLLQQLLGSNHKSERRCCCFKMLLFA